MAASGVAVEGASVAVGLRGVEETLGERLGEEECVDETVREGEAEGEGVAA